MRRPEWILLVLGLAFGCYWRIEGLSGTLLYGDEHHTLPALSRGYGAIVREFDPFGSHVVLPLSQKACVEIFGHTVVSFRLPALVPGIAALLVCYPVARGLVGTAPALVATLALAASPMHVFYSRFARSYALVALLALLLVGTLRRALDARGRGRAWGIAAALLAVLLPYTHLTTLGFVAAAAVASVAIAGGVAHAALPSPRGRSLFTPLTLFGAAAVLCAALYVPILGPVRAYVARVSAEEAASPAGLLGTATLLAGGRGAALAWLVAIPVGLAALWRARRESAIWIGAAIAGPLAFVLASRPPGMEYAYARYLLVSLPFVLMLLAWLVVAAVERALAALRVAPAAARGIALALGVAFVAALHVAGPRSPLRPPEGPFGNTYLSLRRLPAFDAPNPATPRFYEDFAGEPDSVRVIEFPPRLFRSALLYRSYFLRHRKEVLVGWMDDTPGPLRGGPNVDLRDPLSVERSRATYLVVHKNVSTESTAYWNFVYRKAWLALRGRPDAGLMQHHDRFFPDREGHARVAERVAEEMRSRYGAPAYEDDLIFAWRLRGAAGAPP